MQTLESSLLEQVNVILGPDGLITRVVTDEGKTFKYNKAQLEYAQKAAMGFCRRDEQKSRTSLNMLQAATGTGKSIGYLVPLMLYSVHTGERVAVSTFTRHLQKQLLEDAGLVNEMVAKVTGRHASVARRIGRINYVSAVSICRLLDAASEGDDIDVSFLEGLKDWVEAEDRKGKRVNSGILSDYLSESGLSGLPSGIRESSLSLSESDPSEELARYNADIAKSRSADLLIVNHALSMTNALLWGGLLDDEREISVMVFDEADRLPAAAESVLNADITLYSAKSVCVDVAKAVGEKGIEEEVIKLFQCVMDVKPLYEQVVALNGKTAAMERLRKQLNATVAAMNPVAKKIKGMSDKRSLKGMNNLSSGACAEFLNIVDGITKIANSFGADADGVSIASWSPVRAYPSLRIGQAEPGRLLARMWAMRKDGIDKTKPPAPYLASALFTSATIGTPGKRSSEMFSEFMSSIGIVHIPKQGTSEPTHFIQPDLFGDFQPSSFGSMKFVLADPRVCDPFNRSTYEERSELSEDWLDYCAKMISAAHKEGGRTLVLTGAFDDCKKLSERLDAIEDDLLIHERGTGLNHYIDCFKKSKGGVLMSPAAWEGLDLPSVISQIVITRIPNKRPDSIDLVLLKMNLQKKGFSAGSIEGIVRGRIHNDARRKLLQGFGRGIRKSTDKVTVWIADPRFQLPDSLKESLDPIVMDGLIRKANPSLHKSIPARFLSKSFQKARILTRDGVVYSPEL